MRLRVGLVSVVWKRPRGKRRPYCSNMPSFRLRGGWDLRFRDPPIIVRTRIDFTHVGIDADGTLLAPECPSCGSNPDVDCICKGNG